jgi:hypothetical protein
MLARIPAIVLLLIVLALLGGLLAGCGGGGQQSGNGSQGGAQKQGGEAANQSSETTNRSGEATHQPAPPKKVALGTIKSVNVENRKVVLEPSTKQQGNGPMKFNVRKNAEISLDNKPAEMTDIKAGLQAQIEYVTKREVNRATAVRLISDSG